MLKQFHQLQGAALSADRCFAQRTRRKVFLQTVCARACVKAQHEWLYPAITSM